MPSPNELAAAARGLAPQLKAAGFKRFRTDFNKPTEAGLVEVVGLQGNKWGGTFTVNLGVYASDVDQLFDDSWRRSKKSGIPGVDGAVKEYDCWLRARLGHIRRGGRDTWWKYSDVGAAVEDIGARLARDAFPAFTEVSSRDGLVAWWRNRDQSPFIWSIQPRSPLGFALLLKQSGAIDEAQAIVDAMYTQTLGMPFHQMAAVLAEEMDLRWRAT
jgi:hypothetical protein